MYLALNLRCHLLRPYLVYLLVHRAYNHRTSVAYVIKQDINYVRHSSKQNKITVRQFYMIPDLVLVILCLTRVFIRLLPATLQDSHLKQQKGHIEA